MKPLNMTFEQLEAMYNPLTPAQYFACRNAGYLPEELDGKGHNWYNAHRTELTTGRKRNAPALPKQRDLLARLRVTSLPDDLTYAKAVGLIQRAILEDDQRDETYIKYMEENHKERLDINEHRRKLYKQRKGTETMSGDEVGGHAEASITEHPADESKDVCGDDCDIAAMLEKEDDDEELAENERIRALFQVLKRQAEEQKL